MSLLATIPPYECKYCHELIYWADTAHLANCSFNPKNQCKLCGMRFQGDDDETPEVKMETHKKKKHKEGVCNRRLYDNLFSGSELKELVFDQRKNVMEFKPHEYLRELEAAGYSKCKYCDLTFRNHRTVSAQMQSLYHESNCKKNSTNWCRFCG